MKEKQILIIYEIQKIKKLVYKVIYNKLFKIYKNIIKVLWSRLNKQLWIFKIILKNYYKLINKCKYILLNIKIIYNNYKINVHKVYKYKNKDKNNYKK